MMKITYVASKYENPEKTLKKLHAQKLPYTASGSDYIVGEHECCSEEEWKEWYVAEQLQAMSQEGFLFVYILEGDALRGPIFPVEG